VAHGTDKEELVNCAGRQVDFGDDVVGRDVRIVDRRELGNERHGVGVRADDRPWPAELTCVASHQVGGADSLREEHPVQGVEAEHPAAAQEVRDMGLF
jgi:hypothetical protein